MAKIVAVLGPSGDGKTTSTVVNPDGTCAFFNPDKAQWKTLYKGMSPNSHFIINLDDNKDLPFPAGIWTAERNNYAAPKTMDAVRAVLISLKARPEIKSVSLDTINVYLAMKEFNDRKRMDFDQWRDVANDVIEINSLCNNFLRDDQIAYIFGHTMSEDKNDGSTKEVMSVIGKKLRKTPPEAFYSIVINTEVEYGDNGENKHYFITRSNHSSTKTPIGMFADYRIPNSLKLVDDAVRNYYNIK